MTRPHCPHCSHLLVQPNGPPKADILLLGPYPGVEEQVQGFPWVGSAGEVLKRELARVGIAYVKCRATNLWQHAENKECDFEWHKEMAFKEMLGRKAILLMGALTCNVLLNERVSDVSGLRVRSMWIPESTIVYASVNPADATGKQGLLGEVRLAIRRFSEAIKEEA